jgi:hypothetical protein
MKKIVIILITFMLASVKLFAQEDDDNGNEKIRDKMSQYIQERLNLSRSEADKFSPVFLRYFRDWRTALRTTKEQPVIIRQQKIVDLRLRYRDEFKQIIGEKRSNEVFDHQRDFIRGIKQVQQERLQRNSERPRKFR